MINTDGKRTIAHRPAPLPVRVAGSLTLGDARYADAVHEVPIYVPTDWVPIPGGRKRNAPAAD